MLVKINNDKSFFFGGIGKDLNLGRSGFVNFGNFGSHPVFPKFYLYYYFRLWKTYFGFFTRYSNYVKNFKFFYETFTLNSIVHRTVAIRFYLKGIGYKFLRPRSNRTFLRIELGYSISTYVKIPTFIKVSNKRDKILIFGFNKTSIIDFSNKLYSLRAADVYKGKGIRIASVEYKVFKPGKQR